MKSIIFLLIKPETFKLTCVKELMPKIVTEKTFNSAKPWRKAKAGGNEQHCIQEY